MTDKTAKTDMPDVIKYLLGEGQLDGCHFPDYLNQGSIAGRRYWWRKALREAWNTRASQPVSVPETDKAFKDGFDTALKGMKSYIDSVTYPEVLQQPDVSELVNCLHKLKKADLRLPVWINRWINEALEHHSSKENK